MTYKIAIAPVQVYVADALTIMVQTNQSLRLAQDKLRMMRSGAQFVESFDVGGFSPIEIMVENLLIVGGGN